MARTARVKRNGKGITNYHLMSRANDRRFLFEGGKVKDKIVDSLRRSAEFSGVRPRAYTTLDNHFHIVVTVDRTGGPVPEEEVIRRVGVLHGEKAALRLEGRWLRLREQGLEKQVESELEGYRRRMNDISEFIKTFKEHVNVWYKRSRAYCGSLWSGRFTSTIIQDGRYLETCKRYVIYNPIRAGLVSRAADYRWSWCESPEEAGSVPGGGAGSVPERWVMKRVPQMTAGKVFGSFEFVGGTAAALGDRFGAKFVGAHPVGEMGYSTHGWKLAKEVA